MVVLCPRCMAVNTEEDRVCYKCGMSLNTLSSQSKKSESTDLIPTSFWFIIMVVTIPFFGIIFYFILAREARELDDKNQRASFEKKGSKYLLVYTLMTFVWLIVILVQLGLI